MNFQFSQTVNFFGEDYTQIDEFFSIFDQFLSSFSEARAENESLRRRKEDEGKKQATVKALTDYIKIHIVGMVGLKQLIPIKAINFVYTASSTVQSPISTPGLSRSWRTRKACGN